MCLLYTLEVPQAWQAFQRNTAFCFAPLATLVIKGANSQRIQYDQYVRRRCFWTDVDDLSGQICPCLSLFYCRFWWFCDQPADLVSGFLQAAAVYGQKLPNHLISSLQSVHARWIKQWSHSTLLWFSLSPVCPQSPTGWSQGTTSELKEIPFLTAASFLIPNIPSNFAATPCHSYAQTEEFGSDMFWS